MAYFETTAESIFWPEVRKAKRIEIRLAKARTEDELFGLYQFADEIGYPASWMNRDFGNRIWAKLELISKDIKD